MITLTFNKVDSFVAKLQRKGIQVRWDGWDMVFFKSDRRALRNKSGKRWDSEWGFETRVSPNSQGKWLIPHRLVRGANA